VPSKGVEGNCEGLKWTNGSINDMDRNFFQPRGKRATRFALSYLLEIEIMAIIRILLFVYRFTRAKPSRE